MSPLPDVLKVELRIEVNDQPLVVNVQVQGEGERARRAAAELSAVIAAALAAAHQPTDSTIAPTGDAASRLAQPAVGLAAQALPEAPASAAIANASQNETADATRAPRADASSPSLLVGQMQRYRAQISLGMGGLLLALAVLVPAVVPPDQRREVLIMTILFGLTGALLLFTAMLPGQGRQAAFADAAPASRLSASPATKGEATVARFRLSAKRRTPLKAGWGIALGAAFVLLGILAPFTLGATTADERFVIMLGFAPITVIGFFLIAIFGRGLVAGRFPRRAAAQPQPAIRPSSAPAAKRPPVARVPQTFEYRAIVPAAIIGLLVVMIAVVGLVIYAAAASALR
ncbi:MAG: hypothetical protein D6709_03855 [Chloroflexi bacterium]|jgi:hypothetical protein|uniref:Uncharacterized protein n=1 Tax=Candidatus Thermofonsia Clade 3 bacterium TaxID=2364212 RepID=A0A2M8QEG2_9CHLR|nr:hypothetical protein [Candidatus Roseilinea sp. NK_OTU-006]PJF48197.1 MAG: hypothetical protein CUN48_04735 [Candidatus Thermofonsia Clade 3 bacterium]RMG65028.1 MAG: hypothetical protein D6709_03855 [Chloroflexota bacterium]